MTPPFPSHFALAVHSASPPTQLDSFLSLDALYLVASLAGTRTQIAVLTLALVHPLPQPRRILCILRASLRV